MKLFKTFSIGFLALTTSLTAGAATADVVAVVSVRSSVTALSEREIADIFLGKQSRFPNGEPAVPIDQNEDAPVRDEFYAKYAGKSAAQVKAHWSKIIFTGRGQPPLAVTNGGEVKKRLTQNPNAIGYIDESLVDDSVRVLRKK